MDSPIAEYRLIPLSGKHGSGKFAKVDASDFERLNRYRWHAKDRGGGKYAAATRNPKGKPVILLMHREIVQCPPGLTVDHINHDPLDNRRENLRICTSAENNMNGLGAGVAYRAGRWDAVISVGNRKRYLGRYRAKAAALRARDAARQYYYGEFAVLAFPDVEPKSAEELAANAPSAKGKGRSSRFRGVQARRTGKTRVVWAASIGHNGRKIHLGHFATEEEAARAYDIAAYRLHGGKAKVNFPRKEEAA